MSPKIDYNKLDGIIKPPTNADLMEIRTTSWMDQMKLLFGNPVAFIRSILIKDYYLIKLIEHVTSNIGKLEEQKASLLKQIDSLTLEINKLKEERKTLAGGKLEELGKQIGQLKEAKRLLKSRLQATLVLYQSLVGGK
jgi:FtsZ-binding cell division protein ZapB